MDIGGDRLMIQLIVGRLLLCPFLLSVFAEDQKRKVKVLEEQKKKLDHEKELKAQNLESQKQLRKTEKDLMDFEKKLAQAGQPPKLDLEGITKKVAASLDEAIKLIKAGKQAESQKQQQQGGGGGGEGSSSVSGGGGGTSSSLIEPGLSLDQILQRLTNPEWLKGKDMPRNTQTLQVALQARNSLMELERMHQAKMMQMVRGACDDGIGGVTCSI